jgi:hypothetical protein
MYEPKTLQQNVDALLTSAKALKRSGNVHLFLLTLELLLTEATEMLKEDSPQLLPTAQAG